MSTEEFEQWSVWETTPAGGVVVHTPADESHENCDCPGGTAMHENEEWAQEKARGDPRDRLDGRGAAADADVDRGAVAGTGHLPGRERSRTSAADG